MAKNEFNTQQDISNDSQLSFGNISNLAESQSVNSELAGEQWQELSNFADNLEKGQTALINQTTKGAMDLQKSVKMADEATSSDRFSQQSENQAIKTSLTDFGTSFISNRESLRQSTKDFYTSTGDLLKNEDNLAEVGANIWENTDGSIVAKKEYFDSIKNEVVNNGDIFFDEGENPWIDSDNSPTSVGKDAWDVFKPEEYKHAEKREKFQNAGWLGKTGTVLKDLTLTGLSWSTIGAIYGIADLSIDTVKDVAQGNWEELGMDLTELLIIGGTEAIGIALAPATAGASAAVSTEAINVARKTTKATEKVAKKATEDLINHATEATVDATGKATKKRIMRRAIDSNGNYSNVLFTEEKEITEEILRSFQSSTEAFSKEFNSAFAKSIENGQWYNDIVNEAGRIRDMRIAKGAGEISDKALKGVDGIHSEDIAKAIDKVIKSPKNKENLQRITREAIEKSKPRDNVSWHVLKPGTKTTAKNLNAEVSVNLANEYEDIMVKMLTDPKHELSKEFNSSIEDLATKTMSDLWSKSDPKNKLKKTEKKLKKNANALSNPETFLAGVESKGEKRFKKLAEKQTKLDNNSWLTKQTKIWGRRLNPYSKIGASGGKIIDYNLPSANWIGSNVAEGGILRPSKLRKGFTTVRRLGTTERITNAILRPAVDAMNTSEDAYNSGGQVFLNGLLNMKAGGSGGSDDTINQDNALNILATDSDNELNALSSPTGLSRGSQASIGALASNTSLDTLSTSYIDPTERTLDDLLNNKF